MDYHGHTCQLLPGIFSYRLRYISYVQHSRMYLPIRSNTSSNIEILSLQDSLANGFELPVLAGRQAREQPTFTLDHTPSLGKFPRISGAFILSPSTQLRMNSAEGLQRMVRRRKHFDQYDPCKHDANHQDRVVEEVLILILPLLNKDYMDNFAIFDNRLI